jgi:lysophospholipase L1-like esterase
MSAITTDIGFRPEAIHIPFTPSAQAPYTDVQRAIDALYSGAPKLPFMSSIVYAGDSITANGSFGDATEYHGRMDGFMTWAQTLSEHAAYAKFGANAGVSGNTSTQLLARYTTDVLAKSPKLICLLIGTNEVLNAIAGDQAARISTFTANISALVAANRSIGARTILCKIVPARTAAVPMSAPELAVWVACNAAIVALAASDVTVVDFEPYIGMHDANHTVVTGCYKVDAVHPSVRGAFLMGSVIARTIKTIVSSGDYISAVQPDPSKIYNMSGNGVLAEGLGTSLSAGITVVNSVIPRDDGFGQWQKCAFTGASPSAGEHAGILFGGVDYTGVLNAGDTVQVIMEVENIDCAGFGVFGPRAVDLASGEAFNVTYYDAVSNLPSMPWKGILASPPKVLVHNFASVNIYMVGYVGVATTISGSIKVGRVTLAKL